MWKFSISVHEGGHALDLGVCWTTALLNMGTLLKKWLLERHKNIRIATYHPKIMRFEVPLRRKQASDIILRYRRGKRLEQFRFHFV